MGAFAAYAAIGPVALGVLIFAGESERIGSIAEKVQGNTGAVVTLLLFVVLLIAMIRFFRSNNDNEAALEGPRRAVNRLGRIFGKPELVSQKTTKHLMKDFREAQQLFREDRGAMVKPLLFMMASVLMELSIVFVSVKAVGAEVAFAAVFTAFVAANIAGVISVVPGDVGVHEAVIIAVLVAFGVAAPVALSATLLYRVFNKMLFWPIGFYFYSAVLKPPKKS